jgi:choice-of-anchor C domain-containing protein
MVAAAPASANIVTNGSFEATLAYPHPGGSFATLSAGSTAIEGWTVTGHSVDWIYDYWVPSDGSYSIDLNGLGLGGLTASTLLSTSVGQVYRVSFDMAGNTDGLPQTKTLLVTVDSFLPVSFTFDTAGKSRTNMGWVTNTFTFTATSTTTSLSFASGSGGPDPFYGAALDNVRVDPVPEPGTLLLLGGGLSALALRRRRKA